VAKWNPSTRANLLRSSPAKTDDDDETASVAAAAQAGRAPAQLGGRQEGMFLAPPARTAARPRVRSEGGERPGQDLGPRV